MSSCSLFLAFPTSIYSPASQVEIKSFSSIVYGCTVHALLMPVLRSDDPRMRGIRAGGTEQDTIGSRRRACVLHRACGCNRTRSPDPLSALVTRDASGTILSRSSRSSLGTSPALSSSLSLFLSASLPLSFAVPPFNFANVEETGHGRALDFQIRFSTCFPSPAKVSSNFEGFSGSREIGGENPLGRNLSRNGRRVIEVELSERDGNLLAERSRYRLIRAGKFDEIDFRVTQVLCSSLLVIPQIVVEGQQSEEC